MTDPEANETRSAHEPYGLSNSNIIFLGCFLAVYGLIFAANLPILTRDGRIYWITKIMIVAVGPIVVSFFVWLISKRSRRASSIAFNTVLAWFLFGNFVRLIGTLSGE